MRALKPLVFLCIFSLLPLIALFATSDMPHTSDGTMHAIRFGAYFTELMGGQFPVRWTHQFHYGYGTPLFNFTAPLPYMLAVPFIALGFSLTETLKLSFLLTYLLGGIFIYYFSLRLFNSKRAAFLVAIMYQFAPFRLVEMNVRGNLGSLYAYAFVPLFFYSLVALKEKTSYKNILLLTASVSALCLSHTILGYTFIALGMFFSLFQIKTIRKFVPIAAYVFLGVGLAAFFVVPALLEQKYTNGFLFSKDVFYDHFPAIYKFFIPNFFNWGILNVAEISVQIGLFHTLAFFGVMYGLGNGRFKTSQLKTVVFIVIAFVGTIAFMQPVTKPLWENISLIRQFQFPWRFLGVVIFIVSLSAGYTYLLIPVMKKKLIYLFLLFLIITSTIFYWKPTQGYDTPKENYYWNYPLTTNYFSEVNSVWMGEEPTKPAKNKFAVIADNTKIELLKRNSTVHIYTVSTPQKSLVVDNTFYFPGWKAEVNGRQVPIQFQDPNYRGLITFELEPGVHTIKVSFAQSKIQLIGNTISVVSLLILFGLYPLSRLSKSHLISNLRHK